MSLECLINRSTGHRFLISGTGLLGIVPDSTLECLQVRYNKFGIDDLYIPLWVHRSRNMVHIGVVERADHLEDGIHLTDMREEFIPESLPLTCPFYESGDIDKFHIGRNDFYSIYGLAKLF